MRLVYLGTPEMAVPPLDALVAAGHDVLLVVTGADKRRGRGSGTSPSPVKLAAERHAIPVSHTVDDVLASGAELGVVVAFGRIIKPHVLAELPMVRLDPTSIQTNIVIFEVDDAANFARSLKQAGVLCTSPRQGSLRMVTHYGIERADIEEVLDRAHHVAAAVA